MKANERIRYTKMGCRANARQPQIIPWQHKKSQLHPVSAIGIPFAADRIPVFLAGGNNMPFSGSVRLYMW